MRLVSLAASAILIALSTLPAAAQTYPRQAVKIIVPWGPGGGSDQIMRTVAGGLAPELGQPVSVENLPGLSGTEGLAAAARAEADGHTIAQIHEGLLVAHKTGLTDLDWHDFEPVALLTASPQYLAVSAGRGWSTLAVFVAAATEKPRGIRMGVTLAGVPHLHAAMIEDALGLEFTYVGYEGTGERMAALRRGDIDAAIADTASALRYVKSEELRFLATGAAERLAATPDVPTFRELGYDLDLAVTRGVALPEGSPPAARETLETALGRLFEDEEFLDELRALGVEPHFRGHDAYTEHLEKTDETIDRVLTRLN